MFLAQVEVEEGGDKAAAAAKDGEGDDKEGKQKKGFLQGLVHTMMRMCPRCSG